MKKVLFVALLASVALSAAAKKKLAITMTGENLATLTQVTDNQEPCLDPYGGDNGASSADIYTMFDSKGKALSQITESTDAYEEYPSFNKEGNLLVYDKVQRSYYAPVRDNRVFNTI